MRLDLLTLFIVSLLLSPLDLATAQNISRTDAILAKAAKDLLIEAEKLKRKGQQNESADVERISQWLAEMKPGLVEQASKAILARDMVGEWVRPTHGETYRFDPDGTAKAISANGGAIAHRARITWPNGFSAELVWDSGHVWRIYRVDKDRLAVEEKVGGAFVNDGIVMSRR